MSQLSPTLSRRHRRHSVDPYLRISDAIWIIWIISRAVVADDIASGELVELPVGVDVVTGPVGITTRADTTPTLSIQLISRALRTVAIELGFASADTYSSQK